MNGTTFMQAEDTLMIFFVGGSRRDDSAPRLAQALQRTYQRELESEQIGLSVPSIPELPFEKIKQADNASTTVSNPSMSLAPGVFHSQTAG